MIDMYEKYGYYKDDIQSITLKGIEGLEKIQFILETLRKNPPKEIGGYQVTSARDYKLDTIRNMATGEITETGLPKSNVLYYDLTDDAWLCVRPSGTEPKVKFYYGVKGTSLADADEKSKALGEKVLEMIQSQDKGECLWTGRSPLTTTAESSGPSGIRKKAALGIRLRLTKV